VRLWLPSHLPPHLVEREVAGCGKQQPPRRGHRLAFMHPQHAHETLMDDVAHIRQLRVARDEKGAQGGAMRLNFFRIPTGMN